VDNPASLYYACEGLETDDLDISDGDDQDALDQKLRRVQAVEVRHNKMFWELGCDVSLIYDAVLTCSFPSVGPTT
jgi:hypothetical protein